MVQQKIEDTFPLLFVAMSLVYRFMSVTGISITAHCNNVLLKYVLHNMSMYVHNT